MAYPAKERWHKKPTALFGGIAIYLGVSLPLLFITDFSTVFKHGLGVSELLIQPSISAVIWLGMTLLFILGFFDDFLHIKPHTKLVGQILVASLIAFLGFRLRWFTSLTLDTIVTMVWIVGITNAFNLLDNMDGLCAGVGLVSALFMGYLLIGRLPEAGLVAMILSGSLAAFLIYNFNPASIFMGDCGSLIIGFVVSILSLCYSGDVAGKGLSAYAVPIMVLMVPIFDTTLVTFIRILSGRKASTGGKDHSSHRLVLMGLSEKRAVLSLCGIGVVSGFAAVFVSQHDTLTSPAVIIPIGLSVLLMGIYLAQIRVYPEKEFSRLRNQPYTPILLELTYKRQLLLVMLDFCLIAFAYYLSYRLRFESHEFAFFFPVFLRSLPAVIACKLVSFFITGVYRGIWRYMSTNDVFVHLKASLFGTLLAIAVITLIYRFEQFSKSIFIIDWFLTTGFLIGTRGSFRIFVDTVKRKTLAGDRVLIYGAGCGGEILLREILSNKQLNLKPIGFIDDDLLKSGKKLLGYPVLGTLHDVEAIIKKHAVAGLLVSFNHRHGNQLEEAKALCRANDIYIKRFSISLEELWSGPGP